MKYWITCFSHLKQQFDVHIAHSWHNFMIWVITSSGFLLIILHNFDFLGLKLESKYFLHHKLSFDMLYVYVMSRFILR